LACWLIPTVIPKSIRLSAVLIVWTNAALANANARALSRTESSQILIAIRPAANAVLANVNASPEKYSSPNSVRIFNFLKSQ